VELSTPMPPNKLKVEAPVSNDYSMSEYYRFVQVFHSMPPLEGLGANFDVAVEQVDGSPSDGRRELFVLYADGALWHQVMKTKDLQPELLRWYLQRKEFDFVVHDKVDPDQI